MIRQIALLRGINVGGKNAVPMVLLRELFESLGHIEVVAVLQSGNIVFTSTELALPDGIEAAVFERFGVATRVVVVDKFELAQVIADNPFAGLEPTTVHVGFAVELPTPSAIALLDIADFAPEELVIGGRHFYLHLPGGMGRAKLPPSLERRLQVPITFRNWNSVTRLAGLARG
ncbi:DUF1697 domain-containing protein [Ferrimicrobium sp.]|uniref:DUF1697 domain-containing protein n=1 Tax=Ferrimicrobium sp. TaxID=2926050 RepID=UPI0026257D38|nr:DUF1697 domain-containing protein [Ferrimicrobium sp.]